MNLDGTGLLIADVAGLQGKLAIGHHVLLDKPCGSAGLPRKTAKRAALEIVGQAARAKGGLHSGPTGDDQVERVFQRTDRTLPTIKLVTLIRLGQNLHLGILRVECVQSILIATERQPWARHLAAGAGRNAQLVHRGSFEVGDDGQFSSHVAKAIGRHHEGHALFQCLSNAAVAGVVFQLGQG